MSVVFDWARRGDAWRACFGPCDAGYELTFNFAKTGRAFFERGVTLELNRLLIHEFAHKFGGHLERAFDDAMADLGAALTELALTEPEFFERYGRKARS